MNQSYWNFFTENDDILVRRKHQNQSFVMYYANMYLRDSFWQTLFLVWAIITMIVQRDNIAILFVLGNDMQAG